MSGWHVLGQLLGLSRLLFPRGNENEEDQRLEETTARPRCLLLSLARKRRTLACHGTTSAVRESRSFRLAD